MEKVQNVAVGSLVETQLEAGFFVLRMQNKTLEPIVLERPIDSSFIQFHFCLKGWSKFMFNQGNYALDVAEDHSLLLYNTQKDLPLHLQLGPDSWLLSVVISIRKFHSLFSKEADYISFLSGENRDKKYYSQDPFSPAIAIVLSQLMGHNMHTSLEGLYCTGKVYELMALYFNKGGNADVEQCPFLDDEENVKRIRKAKEIIIARMAEPPSLAELSDEIGLSLKKLKEGFKQVYGDSVYSFLFDYKMEYARKMLETGGHNVNEVGLRVGYSTASHFIAAFKKKYGTTPKKYLMALGGA